MKYLAIILCFSIIILNCSNPELLKVDNIDTENSQNDALVLDDSDNNTKRIVGVTTLFSDGWNLDAALDSRVIGTLVVTIHTSDKWLAGTDCDIYFGMRLSDGRTYERKLDKEGYNDFEKNDLDDYFLYVGDKTFYPNQVTSIWLRSVSYGSGPDWHVDYLKVKINGVNVYSKTINAWINPGTTYTMSPVNFPAATDIPKPITN
ncbi:MAG: hypothetical protein A2086_03625 [Spirochaetes bacterium GWD1_27_9]|nr:MAG: hypothetical protein A2Z98_10350 [Spirochaetes bacterium GWB1_27_13]OHD25451.1 MAG: hypothetical protein A2Y34_17700 [Spirochaetes bacterium GWC1_27_15]OHD44380.1 MAG: hypothetical protein A2086_03625 [Spirochaetes bacterium GWD1_27_9]